MMPTFKICHQIEDAGRTGILVDLNHDHGEFASDNICGVRVEYAWTSCFPDWVFERTSCKLMVPCGRLLATSDSGVQLYLPQPELT